MKKYLFLSIVLSGVISFLSGCATNPDGVKSETYSLKTEKTQKLIIE